MPGSLLETIARIRRGDHVCFFYDDPAEQLTSAAHYIHLGLQHNERCLYICDDCTPDALRARLRQVGVAVADVEQSGQLVLLGKNDSYLAGGYFDPEAMLAMLNSAVENALDAGYSGLRAAGEMTWVLENAPGAERILEYETLMSQFYPTARALGLCQYNCRRMPAHIDGALRVHPLVLRGAQLCENRAHVPLRDAERRQGPPERRQTARAIHRRQTAPSD